MIPELYRDRINSGEKLDPIGTAWREALTSVAGAYHAIGELRRRLEERAKRLPVPSECPFVDSVVETSAAWPSTVPASQAPLYHSRLSRVKRQLRARSRTRLAIRDVLAATYSSSYF